MRNEAFSAWVPSRLLAPRDLPPWPFALVCAAAYLALHVAALGFPEIYSRHVAGEVGLLENLQVGVIAVALALTLALLGGRALDVAPGARRWLALVAGALFFLLGEEISWGQHVFHWETPAWLAYFNDQGETNLHNAESWLDQKPRAFLMIAILVGGVIHPLAKLVRGRGLFDRPWWLAPTIASTPAAVFALLAGLPKRIGLDAAMPFPEDYRASEAEELFVYIFFVAYLLSLGRRARSGAAFLAQVIRR